MKILANVKSYTELLRIVRKVRVFEVSLLTPRIANTLCSQRAVPTQQHGQTKLME